MPSPYLLYFADPMCSWCYGFSPVIEAIEKRFGAELPIRLVLGGLRPGTVEPLTDAGKAGIQAHWEHVHDASGQSFDHAFFARDGFVYDTEPACRAVVVMRRRDMASALAGLRLIHAAFYAGNRDVTDPDELTELAAELGFEADSFRAELLSDAAMQETAQDFAISQSAGIGGFPTLIAGNAQNNEYAPVTRGFQRAEYIIPALEKWLAAIG
ncbi:MAG: DsbA family protein [Collimonas sp.]